ncbi:MAG TPA: hypothetical protein VFZ32_00250 [Micromonosporaceae bacterium]
MTDQPRRAASPWARPDTGDAIPAAHRASLGVATPPVGRVASDRRVLKVFGWAGASIVGIGLVVVVVLALTGTFAGPDPRTRGAGVDPDAPPLAKLCPPPTATGTPGYAEPEPPPPGKRTVDERAGISYTAYGNPWQPWRDDWSGGDLKVHYRVGQHFVTERYVGGDYHASILSGSVPATVNDGFTLDLRCVGRQVTADVRRSYYPQPNRIRQIREQPADLGGRPAWVSVFRLYFRQPGLKATDELVAVVLVDVGRPEAAVLYVSIPGTHRGFDHVVDDVIDSVRPTD